MRGRRSACCCRSASRWAGRSWSRWAGPMADWCRRRQNCSPPSWNWRKSGELTRHIAATLTPRLRRLRPRRGRGHAARRRLRLLGPGAATARSHRAGAARDPVDRLGAAVHPVARHFRDLEDRADRGRGVFPGLSRRDGRDPVGRPQDRRGRPHLPALRPGDDPAHSVAGGVAGLCGFAARRAWAGLDVRGRRRIHGRVRRPRLSPDRRPATGKTRADPGGDRDLRHSRQDHRLADRDRHRAIAALAGAFGRQGGAA